MDIVRFFRKCLDHRNVNLARPARGCVLIPCLLLITTPALASPEGRPFSAEDNGGAQHHLTHCRESTSVDIANIALYP